MARRKELTTEEKQILKDYAKAWRKLTDQAEFDMRLCQRGEVKLSDCEFETVKTSTHTALHIMRFDGEILEIRYLQNLSGSFQVWTEADYVTYTQDRTQSLAEGELSNT